MRQFQGNPQLTVDEARELFDVAGIWLAGLARLLSASQIGSELYVSHSTVRTHIRRLYAKLGTRTRAEAVARALGLLAPLPARGKATLPG